MTDREAMKLALEALEKDPAPLNAINNAKCFLYLALEQQEREWVGLTGDEVNDLKHWLDHRAQWSYIEFASAIEAKLKEKNT